MVHGHDRIQARFLTGYGTWRSAGSPYRFQLVTVVTQAGRDRPGCSGGPRRKMTIPAGARRIHGPPALQSVASIGAFLHDLIRAGS